MRKDLHEANRASWNEATKAHNSHKGDQAAFFRAGGHTLFPEEMRLLGDLHGQTLVHLQCNAGQDTLSIADQLGAQVTGVDISDEAISFAQKLAQDAGIPATFIRADVFDWFETNTTQFDVAFVSYGALCWLSDINAWGRGVASVLKPGGRLVVMEFHPFMTLFEEDWRPHYDYMGGKLETWDEGVGDYVGWSDDGLTPGGRVPGVADFQNPHPSHEFAWGLGDVFNSVLQAGLTITQFKEYPYVNGWRPFPNMRELPGRRYTRHEGDSNLPMMYGLVAQKPD